MAGPRQTLCKDRDNSASGLTTITATVGATPNIAGNTLTAHISVKSTTNSCTGVTDSAGNTWSRVGASSLVATNAGETIDIFECQNPLALVANTGTVVAQMAFASSACELIVVEWPGTYAVDVASINSTDSGSVSTTTPTQLTTTPANPNSILVARIVYGSNTVPSIASGSFTFWDSQNHSSGSANQTAIAYSQQTAIATDGAVWSTPSTKSAQSVFAIYPVSSGGGSASLSDSVPLATSLTANEAAARATVDSVPLSTSLARAAAAQLRSSADAVPLSTSLVGQRVSPRATADTVPLASSLARTAAVKSRGMSDSVGLATAVAVRVHLAAVFSDSVALSTSLVASGGTSTYPSGSMAGGALGAPVMAGSTAAVPVMAGGVSVGPRMKGH